MNLNGTAIVMVTLPISPLKAAAAVAPASGTAAEFDEEALRHIIQTLLPGEGPIAYVRRRHDMLSRVRNALYHCELGGRICLLKVGSSKDPAPNPLLNDLLVRRPPASFRVPRLYGTMVSNDTRFELWEFIDGSSKFLELYDDDELERLLRAIAASDSQPLSTFEGIRKTYWLMPMAAELSKAAVHFPEFGKEIDQFSSIEQRLTSHVETLGSGCITHNDLHGHNIIIGRKDYYLVDWESASLGPPGATLRTFMGWRSFRVKWVIMKYVSFMKEFGARCSGRDIHFAMRMHHAYMKLRTGIRLRKPNRLRYGFHHFGRLELELTRRR